MPGESAYKEGRFLWVHGFKWLLGPIALACSVSGHHGSERGGWGQGRRKWKGKKEEKGGERRRKARSQYLPQEQAPSDITSFPPSKGSATLSECYRLAAKPLTCGSLEDIYLLNHSILSLRQGLSVEPRQPMSSAVSLEPCSCNCAHHTRVALLSDSNFDLV